MEIRFLSASRVGRTMLAAAAASLISIALPALAQEDVFGADAAENQPDLEISQETLDGLLAPIALYPDALLAQVLMAATYPADVIEAADWERENPGLSEEALQDALAAFDWDPSVKSLVSVPQVLHYMSDSPQWMQALGRVVAEDQPRVMASVQALRKKAQDAGNLASSSRQTVAVDVDEVRHTEYITITPVSRRYIYVPAYRPDIVYGNWWWPSRPHYWGAPSSGFLLGSGFFWSNLYFPSVALWGGFNWGGREIVVNVPAYKRYYRASPPLRPRNVWRPSLTRRHPGIGRHRPHRSAEQRFEHPPNRKRSISEYPSSLSGQRIGDSPGRKWSRQSAQRPSRLSKQRPERLSEPPQVRSSRWRSERPSEQRMRRLSDPEQARSSKWRSERLSEQGAWRSSRQRAGRSSGWRDSRPVESRPSASAPPSRPAVRSVNRQEMRIRHEHPRESPRSFGQRASRRDSWRGNGRQNR